MNTTAIPSLFGGGHPGNPGEPGQEPARGGSSASSRDARDLVDLLYDGFYMIFLMRNRWSPPSESDFRERLREFFAGFERGAQRLGAASEDVHLSKFAFAALVDEMVMRQQLSIRPAWEIKPLQLELFGEHMAGERFFEHLEKLRNEGAPRLQVLQVFHMCLLLGFQGRYALEGSEKLNYLTSRVGDDIANLRGRQGGLAPHWAAPDRIAHQLKNEVPLWAVGSIFALLALLAYMGLATLLNRQTAQDLRVYNDVVKLAPQAAHVTITLP